MAKDKIAQLESVIYRAEREIAAELERRAAQVFFSLARKHPDKEVSFCSAMGAFDFSVDGHYITPPILDTFDLVSDRLGWNAIPAPVMYRAHGGRYVRLINWGTWKPFADLPDTKPLPPA